MTSQVNLGVLTRWVSPELVAACVSGRVAPSRGRPSPLTPEFMVLFVLARALWSQDSYEDVLDNLTAGVPSLAGALVDKSSLTAARRTLGEAPMAFLFQQVAAAPVAGAGTAGVWWRDRLVLAVDAFTLEMRESPANRAVFGAPVTDRGLGYPQAKVLTVTEAGSHGLRGAAIGPYGVGDRELCKQVTGVFTPGQVLLFDAGFPSVDLLQQLEATQAAVVMRAGLRIGNRCARRLPDGTYLTHIRSQGNNKSTQPQHQVTMRVIDYQVDGGKKIRLLTNLLDPAQAPATEIAALYAQRWQGEQANREIKTIQQGPDYVLRSGTPDMVRQEIWAHLIVHVCLNRLATDIAERRGTDPDRVSFIKVLKHARRTVIAQLAHTTHTVTDALTAAADTITAMAADTGRFLNPARRPRSTDRTLKRRGHGFPLRNSKTAGQPVTTTAPPHTITLQPMLA